MSNKLNVNFSKLLFMGNKRGVSAIVATVLVILITISTATIVSITVLPMVRDSLDFSSLEGNVYILDSGYTAYDSDKEIAMVQVRRDSDDGVMEKIIIALESQGNSFSSKVVAPPSGGTRVYYFDTSSIGVPGSVSVAPIFTNGEMEKAGDLGSKVNLRDSGIVEVDELIYEAGKDYPGDSSCLEILRYGNNVGSGMYDIDPDGDGSSINVYCDMETDGGGWTLVWWGLPTQARYLQTDGERAKVSGNITFNEFLVEGVNIDFNINGRTSREAMLVKTIPEYYNEIGILPNTPYPIAKFHGVDGVQDVAVDFYFLRGYGNSWRVFYTCVNVASPTYMYIGGNYGSRCTPRSSFSSSSVGCSGGGNHYCQSATADSPKDSSMGLSKREYQETKVYVR